MDKLKTTDLGGFPLVLDDFREFLGRLTSPANHGIYQAFNNMLGGFGTDFIIQGCVVSGSTGAFSITEGWILLSSELIKVDAQGPFDEAVDGTFTKVTTFDPRGNKEFLNGSIADTYEKNRGVIIGLAGTLDFIGPRIEGIIGLEAWLTRVFDAGDYTADTGTWVTSLRQLKSVVSGKTMTVSISVIASTLAGGPSNRLRVKIPQSKTVSVVMASVGFISFGGSLVPAILQTSVSDNTITIQPLDGTNITDGAIIVGGTITFEID